MSKVVTVLLVLVGLINFLPVLGVLSAGKVSSAYAVEFASPDLEILLRHRALLFGIVGGFILYAAFVPQYQAPAMVMAAVSMVGFLVLAWSVGGLNEAIRKVVLADIVGVLLLSGAAIAWFIAEPAGFPLSRE